MMTLSRRTRPGRRWAATLLALTTLLSFAMTVGANAPMAATRAGVVPTIGQSRPGLINAMPPARLHRSGVRPTAIRIAKARVDAEVETVGIVDGVMQDPTGPWVVSWYKETAKLGEPGNAVMAGHLDYWDVGPAVFSHLGDVVTGDEMAITGADHVVYTYRVAWVKLYDANADAKAIAEIVGRTNTESVTLITCGGPFDYDTGHYRQRMVVRATRIAP